MTAYETVMVILGILALLVSFGGLMLALLTFLDRDRKKRKKIMPTPSANGMGASY